MDNSILRIGVWILIAAIAAIVGAAVRNKRKRRLQDVVAVLSQAVSGGKYSEALAVAREFLCIPCKINGLRKNQTQLIQQTLSSQMTAANHLRTIYQKANTGLPEKTIQQITDAIAKQQSIVNDDQIFSFVHGGPKKEVVQNFNDIQNDKEQLSKSLPPLA